MSDAEQTGYRLAAWAHAHPATAKLIGGSGVLALGGFCVFGAWQMASERPIKAAFAFLGLIIVLVVHLLARGAPKQRPSNGK